VPTLATPEGLWLWTVVLALALLLPLRRLVFVLAVRREHRRTGADVPAARQRLLRWRATVTAALLGLFFSALYVHALAGRLAPSAQRPAAPPPAASVVPSPRAATRAVP
jgi:hypothetical protein